LRLAIALILFAAVLLATLVAATLSRWWVQNDVSRLLDDIGWRPPGMGPGQMRARILREVFVSTGFARRLTDSVLISGLIGAALAGLAGYLGATWLAQPLSSSAGRLRRLAGGDLRHAGGQGPDGFPESSIDEVAAISAAVDSLTSQLAMAEDLRRRLVEDLIHELRSPLTAVRGYAEGLRDGVFADPASAVSGLERELRRVERLLSDLRYSALPTEVGAFAQVDLAELVRSVAAGFEKRARERQVAINVSVNVAADLPGPLVMGDPDRLGQVVSNLLDNALEFAPPATGQVKLEVVAGAGREGHRLVVEDNGPGIPAKDLPHIFDRLYRADTSRARSTGGSGIGLAIVKQIVLGHGGAVTAQNAPGGGARLVVSLPRARQQ
jgi:signal transduction histidine kinase